MKSTWGLAGSIDVQSALTGVMIVAGESPVPDHDPAVDCVTVIMETTEICVYMRCPPATLPLHLVQLEGSISSGSGLT